jgi:spore coat polysaccharide biosynthesis protein SpsF (cytidylyltransferase family)
MSYMVEVLIQARMSSTRLPGKVLLPLGGSTVLENVFERSQKAKLVNEVVLVTSNDKSDDPIEKLCEAKGFKCYRGSLNDVLDRYYQAAKLFNASTVVRITGDCPLIDPHIIDRVIRKFNSGKYDYVSTGREVTTFPDGLDTEVFSFASLERAWKEAKLPSEREHVTPYIWKNIQEFRVCHIKNKVDLSSYRLTLDEPNDYALLKEIFDNVSPLKTSKVLEYIDSHPKVRSINADIKANEGYYKSLREDEKFKANG